MTEEWLGRLVAQRYRIIARLGDGTSSVVWLARHVLLDQLVALKTLREDASRDPERHGRLLREARASSRLHHPHLVEIADAGEDAGAAFIAMEYVPGATLEDALARGPLGARRAAWLGECLAGALARGHEMDVVHGRLSPRKVLLVPRRDGLDDVKLLGLGIPIGAACDAGDLDPAEWPHARAYAAPELLATGAPTPRADLHALGAVIEAAMCGGQRGLSPDLAELADIVRTLVAADPGQRPRDAFEALDMFRRVRAAIDGPEQPEGGPRERAATVRQLSFDRIAPLCVGALARVEVALPRADDAASIEAPRRLTALVEDLAELAAADARQLAAVDARGRRLRSDLGRRIDQLASERSRALGWAGTLAEQTERVRESRFSGEHSVGVVDAMVWEQAALEHEESRAFVAADELALRIADLSAELQRADRAIDDEHALVAARLEGHIAALRALAVEAWAALESAAATLSVALDDEVRRARA